MNARILVVDDSSLARRRARNALEGAGYLVDEAEDGMAALERGHAVLGFDDLEAAGLENPPRAAPGQPRVVDDQDAAAHNLSSMTSNMCSSVADVSLNPASTTERGMP